MGLSLIRHRLGTRDFPIMFGGGFRLGQYRPR
jgi:hypothetical protein